MWMGLNLHFHTVLNVVLRLGMLSLNIVFPVKNIT